MPPFLLAIHQRFQARSRQSSRRRAAPGAAASRATDLLELRSLLSAVVGTVYDDADGNGVRNNGENGIPGWTVYLDLDNSGTLNNKADGAPEPSAVSNQDGDYTISGVSAGLYRVAEIVQPGWRPTQPSSQDLVADGKKDSRADFFNFAGGTIVGSVWNDLNGDGVQDAGDAGMPGWTVYLDLNTNLTLDADEPSTLSDESGGYQFSEVPSGDYEVSEILPAGWEPSKGFDTHQTVAVSPLNTSTQDFANFSLTNGSVSGTIWNDLNGDGDRAADPVTGLPIEPGLAEWTVFADTNGNRIPDAGEVSTTTSEDGSYKFISLPAGTYSIAELMPSGTWSVAPGFTNPVIVTVFAGEKTNGIDFANFTVENGAITGSVWNDLNRDGIRNSDLSGTPLEPGLTGWTVYLDMNRNKVRDTDEPAAVTDLNGQYLFPDLQIGEYEVIEIIPTGWETAPTFGDNQSVFVYSGATSVASDFANFNLSTLIPGSVSGTVWNDVNGNGVMDTTSTPESGVGGWLVYADLNANGVLDSSEPQATSAADGTFTISGVNPGSALVRVTGKAGWRFTSPISGSRSLSLKNGETVTGVAFGAQQIRDSGIYGTVFADRNRNGLQDTSERGLPGITVYLDLNGNAALDADEPSTVTSADQFYTPETDETGTYSFTHIAAGTYQVRQIIPAILSATPSTQFVHTATVAGSASVSDIHFADVFRANEIHGVKFDDANENGIRDSGEPGVSGTRVYIDLNRNNLRDAGEPETITGDDGSYSFIDLSPGAYVVREELEASRTLSFPGTKGGILWPAGTSNPAVGNVTPSLISVSLANGELWRQNCSITLPGTGGLTNMVDVFLLFDDTGSFVNNSPIVRGAFPTIISQLQTALPGIDLGFGVGRFEEYGNFAAEYSSGRPFILNQPVVASTTANYMTAIQSALNRTTPGYGGDQPETDIEALYQLVTGLGFDGNNNGSVFDSGAAGLASTQLSPGISGDVPSFASFTADAANGVLRGDGSIGGGGFRSGALPVILLATDTGFAYQPKGETSVTGLGGLALPVSSLTQTSRPTTPFSHGAGLQETVTGLNALGALVIGLGTNAATTTDPRQGLEALAKLTGATNQSSATIANGTPDAIAPGDPFYFQIASGFASSVATGVTSAIQNAVTNVAVNINVKASDPRVHIINHTGTLNGIRAGGTANFDLEFVGDGVPHRFDLQFVREGTSVVLGSIPVVMGTPIPGDGYHFDDLSDGEIELEDHFGDYNSGSPPVNVGPSFASGASQIVPEDSGLRTVFGWATSISAGPPSEAWQTVSFTAVTDHPELFAVQPAVSPDGTLTWRSADNASGIATISVTLHDSGGTANGGTDTSAPQLFTIEMTPVNDAPVAADDSYSIPSGEPLAEAAPGVLANDSDIEGDILNAVLVSDAAFGTVVLSAKGSFSYVSTPGFSGTDSFTYRVNDGTLDSGLATVTLTVIPFNHAPGAADDNYSIGEDSTLTILQPGVLANDADPDGDTLTANLVTGPAHGTLTLSEDGSFLYVPHANFNGTDSFTYMASDGVADSGVGTVRITVTAVNDRPVAADDSYSVDEDGTLSLAGPAILANDLDVDGDALVAHLIAGPAHGLLTQNTDGSFTYNPALNYYGPDSFSYTAGDGALDSGPATVHLTIRPVNDVPVAMDDSYSAESSSTLVIGSPGVLGNDFDVDGDALTVSVLSGPANGTVALNPNGSLSYTPNAGFSGMDSFTYAANDGLADSGAAVVRITVNPVTPPPAGNPQFQIVDSSSRQTFRYDASGSLAGSARLDKEDQKPRGIATNTDGTLTWVIDDKGEVFVYDKSGRLLGTWQFEGVDKAEGIAVLGNDLLIIDRANRQIVTFAGAASRRSGAQAPTSTFSLDRTNRKATDLATDGTHIWVIDDSSMNVVYRYSVSGTLTGKWILDAENSQPTGIACDSLTGDLWIVDSAADRVFRYAGAGTQITGNLLANSSFSLNAMDGNPQGIAISHVLAAASSGTLPVLTAGTTAASVRWTLPSATSVAGVITTTETTEATSSSSASIPVKAPSVSVLVGSISDSATTSHAASTSPRSDLFELSVLDDVFAEFGEL